MNQTVELVVLAAIFCVAAPCSVVAFYHLWGISIDAPRRRVAPHFLALQRSLNACDLFITFIYLVQNFCLTWTNGEFLVGDAACKVMHFAQTLAFHACSNTIAAIAIHRLRAVCVVRPNVSGSSIRATALTAAAWSFAFLLSVPQFLIWETASFEDEEAGEAKQLCTMVVHVKNQSEEVRQLAADLLSAYTFVHTATISIVPAFVAALCYAVIYCKVDASRRRTQSNVTVRIERRQLNDASAPLATNDSVVRREPTAPTTSVGRQPSNERLATTRVLSVSVNAESESGSRIWGTCLRSLLTSPPLVQRESPSTGRTPTVVARQNRTLRTSVIFVIVYGLCWLPYNGVVLWSVLYPETFREGAFIAQFGVFCITLQALANPFIYRVYNR